MKSISHLLALVVLICGCSTSSDLSSNGNSNSKLPDNFVAIKELVEKHSGPEEEYEKIVGEKISVAGFVSRVSRSIVNGELNYTLTAVRMSSRAI